MIRNLAIGILLIFANACSVKPVAINYGEDACHFCKMNIVEKTHAAQMVSSKGKVYNYDAIECMLNDLEDKDRSKIGLILVTDYDTPENLIDATQATFLISDSIQSPMGANLTGFEDKFKADAIIQEHNSGQLYDWTSIQKLFYQ